MSSKSGFLNLGGSRNLEVPLRRKPVDNMPRGEISAAQVTSKSGCMRKVSSLGHFPSL